MKKASTKINKIQARNIWIAAQKLNEARPFGSGPEAVARAVAHLGYVQIDTINVIERCHHHILYNRIPGYRRSDLHAAQSAEKSVFEYWTHALAYVPTADYPYFKRAMNEFNKNPRDWYESVTAADEKKVLGLLKKEGPIFIRDIKDDVLVEKTHPWGSAKPSKKALQKGFYGGQFVISERSGIVKKYDLWNRHFGRTQWPKAATENEYADYILNRALRAQGIVNLDSVCFLENEMKPLVLRRIEKKVKSGELIGIEVEGCAKPLHWGPASLPDQKVRESSRLHILSPFDPLLIQRKRLSAFFDYDHVFEAYVPKEKRKFGYFTLPVLKGNEFIALLDLKADRAAEKLLIQSWHWLPKSKSAANRLLIESELERFEKFQLAPR